jgi:hypothetical protein
MANLDDKKTLGSCVGIHSKIGISGMLFIEVSPKADRLSIVQGICVEYTSEKKGIGKLLFDAGMSIDDALKNPGEIAFPIPLCDNQIELFYGKNGRVRTKKFTINKK